MTASSVPAIRDAAVTSWEDHLEAWHHYGRRADDCLWGRAAVAASLKGRYGEAAITTFAKEVGIGKTRLYELAKTYETFGEESTRVETLTFTHHLYAATMATDPAAAIATAQAEGLSANDLRRQLRPPRAAKALPAPTEDFAFPPGEPPHDPQEFYEYVVKHATSRESLEKLARLAAEKLGAKRSSDAGWVMRMRRGRRTRRVPRQPSALAKFLVSEWTSTDVDALVKAVVDITGRRP